MVAFAANSLLCRVALKEMKIDAASFTAVRIFSGAAMLWLVLQVRRGKGAGNWTSAAALFLYAAAFSFAYISLPAGTGALLLFAAVQATMIGAGISKGERLHLWQWLGVLIAFGGLVLLLLPGIAAPPLAGSFLMLAAGVAWGVYSLRGQRVPDAVATTAGNFIRAALPAAIMVLAFSPRSRITPSGLTYALVSGAMTSGLGYVVWYTVLPSLHAASAATVQLGAPVIAALGGVLLLGESVTLRMIVASAAVLGGIALVLTPRQNAQSANCAIPPRARSRHGQSL